MEGEQTVDGKDVPRGNYKFGQKTLHNMYRKAEKSSQGRPQPKPVRVGSVCCFGIGPGPRQAYL